MISRPYFAPCLVILVAMLSLPAASGAEPVPVMINDKPIDLKGVSPTVVSGRVFVPVRPIAEMLGAGLNWHRSSRTLTVFGRSGRGVIRLGHRLGRIRGRSVYFPYAPFLRRGRVFAPIIFFNELFDMALVWDPFRQVFKWQAIVPVRPYAPPTVITPGPTPEVREPEAPPVPPTNLVVGEAIRSLPSRTDPRIVVQVAGKTLTYRVARDAVIVRGRLSARGAEVPLGEIRSGDRVTLRLSDDGVVLALRAQYKEIRGTVQSIAKETVLLDSGLTLRISPQTQIILPGNERGQIEDINPGDLIVARVAPISGEAYVIDVLSESPQDEEEEDQITLTTYGPLRPGDVLIITFRGRANGKANYTIPGTKLNEPMMEVEPGVYRGEYTIREGDLLPRQPIRVRFREPGGATYEALSRRPVTIVSIGSYLPRITSPRQGQTIDSPIIVTGFAKPGSVVRVTVEYRKDMQGILPLEGLTAVEDVRADDDGIFRTPPMAAAAPFEERKTRIPGDFGVLSGIYRFKEYPTAYVITAIALGADGQELAGYSVEVLKGRGERLEGAVPLEVEPRKGLLVRLERKAAQ